ncbi:MAG: Gfo/Idh/MocA family oxidoreductase [Chloroflexi bacterium]|nr:Gfo/Idh/MocA family oxidoreductase [Chloroflexota bacterium]
MIRIGFVGCGAVVQSLHLPAIRRLAGARATWLVDVQVDRVKALAAEHGISNVTAEYAQVADVDAVLIATPHYLHAPMAEFFLMRGIHVLCEKPLAIAVADAERLVGMAKERRLVLAAGVFRRYYPNAAFVRRAIQSEWLGAVERIDAEEGWPHDWDAQSRFMLERCRAGGGVLVDTGSHTLDRVLWWFGSPDVSLESYRDNSASGVETDCEVRFSVPWRNHQIPVRVELSRTRRLRNTFQVITSFGTMESPVNAPDQLWFTDRRLGPEPIRLAFGTRSDAEDRGVQSFFEAQLSDFCTAISMGADPLNAGATAIPVIRLIASCYDARQPLPEPWVDFGLDQRILFQEETVT